MPTSFGDVSSADLDIARLSAARLWAASRMPYLATALFAETVRVAPGSRTIAVDPSWQLHVDPQVLQDFDVAGLGRLLVHLTGHLIRDHAARGAALRVGERATRWWDDCADFEINDDLDEVPGRPSVADGIPMSEGLPPGELAEVYFAARPEPPAPQGDRWDCGSGADGVVREWDLDADLSPSQVELLRHRVADEIRQYERSNPGAVAEGWLRWATAARSSTPWQRVLAAEVRRAVATVRGRVDYTYQRPSRRATAARGRLRPVLPAMQQPQPTVVVVCDTSGSMDERLLGRALAEVEALLLRAGLRAAGITALAADAEVHSVERVRRADQVRLLGGGGTDMAAGIAAAERLRPRPDVVVVLTDGLTPWPAAPPQHMRVVVGLLHDGPDTGEPPPPPWARVVDIVEPARGIGGQPPV